MPRAKISSPTALVRARPAHSFKDKLSNFVIPFLIAILVLTAFVIGVLYTKVQYLENQSSASAGSTLSQPQSQPPAPIVTNDQLKQLISEGFSQGNPDAKVVFLEFADYQCPFCQRFFTQSEPQLLKDYVNTGKVLFVYHDYPILGQESVWAAEASWCAQDQGRYWDYHNYLFSHQGQENSGAFSQDNLKKFAAALGLNQTSFNSCLDSGKYQNVVTKNAQNAQAAGVSSTPTEFINTKMLAVFDSQHGSWLSIGAAPYTNFQSALDQALK